MSKLKRFKVLLMSKFWNLVVQKELSGVDEYIGFSSNVFMVFGLPTHKLKNNPAFWTKKTSLCSLEVSRAENFEIPYGCYARMNQIFIDTEVRIKNTNEIDIGKSFREYASKLGYKSGKANRALLKQLFNYITCKVKVEVNKDLSGEWEGIQTLVAKRWKIHFDIKNPNQIMMDRGKVWLDPEYARYIHEHSVPLDMNVVHSFKRNPLALDFYRFLAYRSHSLPKELAFPDYMLFEQLGTSQAEHKVTRIRLKRILNAIQLYWPVKAKFTDGFFILNPSPPAVQERLPKSRKLNIIVSDQDFSVDNLLDNQNPSVHF